MNGRPSNIGSLNCTGQHTRALDDKSRVPWPATWRNAGGGLQFSELVLMPSPLLDCIRVVGAPTFEEILAKVEQMASSNVTALFYRRAVIGNAHRVSLDSAGRLAVPESLRDLLKVGRELVLVGQGSYVELWEPEAWRKELARLTEAGPAYLERLAEMGL
jgi:MraZ protein